MKRPRIATLSILTLMTLGACSSGSPEGDGPVGGAGSASGGAMASAGGMSASAGASLGGGGNAAAGTAPAAAGSAPIAGTSAVAGTGSGGGGAAAGGASGVGGAGGSSVGGTGGGGSLPVKPSAGCAKASAQVTIPNSLIGIPMGYAGTTPVPAVIAFHAAGNDNVSIQNAFKGSDLAKKYLMIYPNSTSATTSNKTGWNMQADKSRYLEVQAAILSQACVDENRIFATGHSSGAQFVVQLLCSGDGDFDGVAPVASSVYCQKWKDGAVPSLIIHGVQDQERTMYGLNDGDGKKDLQPYLTSNMCQMTSTPFQPDVSRCTNIQGIDGKAFNAGCVEFSGCSAKTRWCNHNDPNYGTSNHGIPCFGVRAIYDFFESL
jgi:polyhydroxybutyrate depolymerase